MSAGPGWWGQGVPGSSLCPPPPPTSSQAPVKGHLQEFPITPPHGAWPLLAHTLRCPVATELWLWSRPALGTVGLVWQDGKHMCGCAPNQARGIQALAG